MLELLKITTMSPRENKYVSKDRVEWKKRKKNKKRTDRRFADISNEQVRAHSTVSSSRYARKQRSDRSSQLQV